MPTATLEQLTETTFCESTITVDREAGVIRAVKILGVKSRNNREYSPKAMESAAKLYPECMVNLNHPDRSQHNRERLFEDGIGWFKDIQVRTDGVYGDLHLLKEHKQFGTVCESAERSPRRFGLSHNAEGPVEIRNGVSIVEDIERVYSIDIVRNPATNKGLFESKEHPMPKIKLIELVKKAAVDTKGFKRALLEMEDGGMLDPAMEVEPEESAADAVAEKLADKAKEIFLDPKIDPRETGKRIAILAKAAEDIKAKLDTAEGDGQKKPDESGEDKGEEKMESKLTNRINRLEAQNALLEAGIDATPERISAVAGVPEDQRKKLVESWPAKTNGNKPRSGSVLTESEDGDYSGHWKRALEAARK